ncbi:MAG TPA: hypothetical protein VMT51_15645 [Dongiaceae bacterium]|nr:hypothetical protein [Dongiaceae bacterium]
MKHLSVASGKRARPRVGRVDLFGFGTGLRFAIALLAATLPIASAAAQDKPKQGDTLAPSTAPASKRLTIEVNGGDREVPVENASVYLKFTEEKKFQKDKRYELNVKTNREGRAHIPDPPVGRVLIQIVAEGWKTYGKYFDLTDPGMTIKIHLDRPPKWY